MLSAMYDNLKKVAAVAAEVVSNVVAKVVDFWKKLTDLTKFSLYCTGMCALAAVSPQAALTLALTSVLVAPALVLLDYFVSRAVDSANEVFFTMCVAQMVREFEAANATDVEFENVN